MYKNSLSIILLLTGTINLLIVSTDARDYICALGGNFGCKLNCVPEVDDFSGYCDNKDNCKCEKKPKKSKNGTKS
ncbi:hypothetical protein FQR65_LT03578 [Abscondita terminalis]|nr:hypothetical protein FQR65_LT03578 [Abscondita terminalis]